MSIKRIELAKTTGVDFCLPFELPYADLALLQGAYEARRKACAPYSHYLVGALVLSANGVRYPGCNVEVCSYSQTTHAEQTAVAAMVAREGKDAKIKQLAIVAAHEREQLPNPMGCSKDWDGWPSMDDVDLSWASVPCGHCLVILTEYAAASDIRLIGYHPSGVVSITTLKEAIPFAFGPDHIR